MKRLHVHVAVENIAESVRFYSSVFGAAPTVLKDDYAKWMVEDPRVNFAISNRGGAPGLDHLGIQVEDQGELVEIDTRLRAADADTVEQKDAACCYAKSDKVWTFDPEGIAWENFLTSGEVADYGKDTFDAPIRLRD